MEPNLELEVTEDENEFISLLRSFQKTSELCPTRGPIRLVGGWVRDRLMGIKSHDLDIALEDCTGRDFVDKFEKWLLENTSTHSVRSMVVKANAEKSKHLETAIMDLPEFGLSIDFVNLRSEEYTTHSRIPHKSDFGSPAEDSLRRDLTINALFFNLDSEEIEDWSGKGLDDLRSGILRTPRNAEQTFLDDPLRILRILRFAAKLDRSDQVEVAPTALGQAAPRLFTVDPEIGKVVLQQNIRDALTLKITKDRIRAELSTLFGYPNIGQALWLLMAWKLLPCIFTPLNEHFGDGFDPDKLFKGWPSIGLLVDRVMREIRGAECPSRYLSTSDPLFGSEYASINRRGVLILGSMLANQHKYTVAVKGGSISAAQDALITLKSKNVALSAGAMLDLAFHFKTLDPSDRDGAVVAFRMKSAAKWWEYALILSQCMVHFDPDETLTSAAHYDDEAHRPLIEKILASVAQWRTVLLEDMQLDGLWNYKPLLSGGEIVSLLKEAHIAYRPTLVGALMARQADYLSANWIVDEEQRKSSLLPNLVAHLKNHFPTEAK